MSEPLKEYLVKLGFKVNDRQFKEFSKILDLAENEVTSFATTTNIQMLSAGVAVLSFVATANSGIASYLASLAKADMDTELFAKKMWVSVEQGKAIQASLKATGRSIEDLWYSEELRDQFIELQKVANSVAPPEGFQDSMRDIRAVQLEFMKLKVILSYLSQWIGFYLTKYVSGPLDRIKGETEDISELLSKNLPQIAEKVARFLSYFVRVGESIVWIVKGISSGLIEMPEHIKNIAIALTGLFAIMSANPFTLAVAGISLLLLLIEDYYTYAQGGKSAFGDLWESMFDQEQLDRLMQNMSNAGEEINDLIGNVSELKKQFHDLTGIDMDMIIDDIALLSEVFIGALNTNLEATVLLLEAINGLLDKISGKKPKVDPLNSGSESNIEFTPGFKAFAMNTRNPLFVLFDKMKEWTENQDFNYLKDGRSPVGASTSPVTYTIEQKFENANYITGSDSYAIGNEVDNTFTKFGNLMRNTRGPFAR